MSLLRAAIPLVLFFATPAFAWSGAVSRMDDGSWLDPAGWPDLSADGYRYKDVGAWVDIAIENYGYDKNVGIYWTVDGWATWGVADAWYEGDLGYGYEQWGVDLNAVGSIQNDGAWSWFTDTLTGTDVWIYDQDLVLEYAIFYEIGGTTFWDNNGGANYQVELKVPEYVDMGDGTVIDQTTGLRWLACPMNARGYAADTTADCSRGTPTTQSKAVKACDALTFAGHSGWRLPNTSEIGSNAILSNEVETLWEDVFPIGLATDREYWTITNAFGTRKAYTVLFGPSDTHDAVLRGRDKTANYWVTCVSSD